ncbi:MAG: valine--tRNA ligase [Phycisphaerae bacterium]|jgi:valyl-tRNA synthetase
MSIGGTYDPKSIEPDIYAMWEKDGAFHAEPRPGRQPFSIVIPPPNVTGALHLGHAINNTLQDILIRRARMQGYDTCWLPGTDHAGIATQAVVERRLRQEQGWRRDPHNPEHREFLVGKIREWKDEYEKRILDQLRRMGCSCDWQRTRFTLDEQCAKAVYELFFRLFKDGLIYRGKRLVNWDCELQTAVADDEVYHETVMGHLWHVRYPILAENVGVPPATPGGTGVPPVTAADALRRATGPDSMLGRDFLVVATTRPETMLADTAVAVHPDDARYQHLIGRQVLLPLMNRPIPVIADGELVNPEFGTGCVKVTPGHDPNDYACWQRHQGRPDEFGIIDLFTPDGKINENGVGDLRTIPGSTGVPPVTQGSVGVPPASTFNYTGLPRQEARKRVVADLEALGLLEKIEPYETDIGHSDRSKTPIEPLRSEQWFVRTAELCENGRQLKPGLAEMARDAVRDGRVKFFPERFAKSYLDWLGEKRDWCISRQLWWGHRIPVWQITVGGYRYATGGKSIGEIRQAVVSSVARAIQGFYDALDRFATVFGIKGQLVAMPSGKGETVLYVCAATEIAQRVLEAFYRRHHRTRFAATGDRDPATEPDLPYHSERYNVDQELGRTIAVMSERDPDVLDTWFSSALWPLSTFGWPGEQRSGSANQGAGKGSGSASARPLIPEARSPSDLEYFFPTNVLSTARDIISLWVARMVMVSTYLTGRVPFQHVCIHPTIQDEHGRRMSKSAGNGVDPLDLIEMYGADAMRFTLASLAGETQDVRVPVRPMKLDDGRVVNTSERFELGRNFCNKLWQAATGFVIPNLRHEGTQARRHEGRDEATKGRRDQRLALEDRWILSRLRACIVECDRRLDHYQYSDYANTLYSFFWSDFCDWYVELVKPRLYEGHTGVSPATDRSLTVAAQPDRRSDGAPPVRRDEGTDGPEDAGQDSAETARRVLAYVLDRTLRLLHPVVPFITERLWQLLNDAAPARGLATGDAAAPLLIRAEWPDASELADDPEAEAEIAALQQVIRGIREIRTHVNTTRAAAKQTALRTLPRAVVRTDVRTAALLTHSLAALKRLSQCEEFEVGPDAAKPADAMSKILTGIEVFVPVAGLVDLGVERKRLEKERADLLAYIQRVEGKLSNESFVAKAPPQVVETERARLAELRDKLAKIDDGMRELCG